MRTLRKPLFQGEAVRDHSLVEGSLIVSSGPVNTGKYYIVPKVSEAALSDNGSLSLGPCIEVDPDTVSEWSGMHDSTGKKIWEGDYCRVTRVAVLCYGYISFGAGCFWFTDEHTGSMLRLCDAKPNNYKITVVEEST